MLIKCPECGKEISDKSDKCINCGYPIKNTICIVNGVKYDLAFLLDESYSIVYKVRDLIQISNSDISHIKPIVEQIVQAQNIPPMLNLPIKSQTEEDNKVHCPKCNSTNIQIVPRKWSLLTGILTNKTDRVCVNCKYKW